MNTNCAYSCYPTSKSFCKSFKCAYLLEFPLKLGATSFHHGHKNQAACACLEVIKAQANQSLHRDYEAIEQSLICHLSKWFLGKRSEYVEAGHLVGFGFLITEY